MRMIINTLCNRIITYDSRHSYPHRVLKHVPMTGQAGLHLIQRIMKLSVLLADVGACHMDLGMA